MTRALAAALMTLALSAPAYAQNLAPVARASAAPTSAFPGDVVRFTGSASFDPDERPEPLTFAWDFGDGASSEAPDPSHVYDAPGVYDASLTVRDGAAQRLATLTVHVLEPRTPRPPTASSMLHLDPARDALWVANPDSESVTVVSTARLAREVELPIGARPTTLAASADGTRVLVVARDGAVRVFDADRRRLLSTFRVGHRPYGLARVGETDRFVVTVEGDDRVALVDADGVIADVAVADGPRAVAVSHDGAEAWVTHFPSRGGVGLVTRLALDALAVREQVTLAEDPGPDTLTSGRGVPNLLDAIALDPSGTRVWVGGLKSNVRRGAYLDGQPFVPTNRLRALLAPIRVEGAADEIARRIDANDADSVSAFAFGPLGRWAYVAHAGAGRLSVYDVSQARTFVRGADQDTVMFAARVDAGHRPRAVAVTPDGETVFVLAELSREVIALDVTDPREPVERARIAVTREPLEPAVALGKRLFHRSREPVHSRDDYIACASCHPDGGDDGQTWDFTQFGEGLRNTIDLRGRGFGPIHWSANFDEVQDFENDIVGGFGGTGLAMDGDPPHPPLGAPNAGRSEALDALADYVFSLTEAPASPHRRADGSLTEAAERGRAVFLDPSRRCVECHAPPRFTDSAATEDGFVLHDVGTLTEASGGRLGGPLEGLDTPSLIGLWDGAPYLHDGRAATLEEVLVDHNPSDRHGVTSDLTAAERADLVAYLRSIDGRPDGPEAPADAGPPDAGARDAGPAPGGGGCRVGPSRADEGARWGLGPLLVAALAAGLRRRRETT